VVDTGLPATPAGCDLETCPPGDGRSADLEATLLARHSVRSYPPGPVSLEALTRIAGVAGAADRELWEDETQAGIELAFVLAPRLVPPVPPRAHRYVEAGWCPLTDQTVNFEALFSQQELASAPAALLFVANLYAGACRWGAHGYRLQLLRAGHMGHAAWIAATALGHPAVVVGSADQAEVSRLCGRSDLTARQMFGLVVGPASPEEVR